MGRSDGKWCGGWMRVSQAAGAGPIDTVTDLMLDTEIDTGDGSTTAPPSPVSAKRASGREGPGAAPPRAMTECGVYVPLCERMAPTGPEGATCRSQRSFLFM